MKISTDVLIIGGGPAGAVIAGTAKRYHPDKKIMILKEHDKGVIPCGIPYMLSSLAKPEDNIMSLEPLGKSGIEIKVDKAVSIDRARKKVTTQLGDECFYDKLVLATGSKPLIPPVPGIELGNVFAVEKNFNYLSEMADKLKKAKNIVVLGGGFIGVEFADELASLPGERNPLTRSSPILPAKNWRARAFR